MKDKSTAVILAFVLGIATWLYTYGANKKKFWIALAVAIFGMFIIGGVAPLAMWVWAIFDATSTDSNEYKRMN